MPSFFKRSFTSLHFTKFLPFSIFSSALRVLAFGVWSCGHSFSLLSIDSCLLIYSTTNPRIVFPLLAASALNFLWIFAGISIVMRDCSFFMFFGLSVYFNYIQNKEIRKEFDLFDYAGFWQSLIILAKPLRSAPMGFGLSKIR